MTWIISILAVIIIAEVVFLWQLWTELDQSIKKNNQLKDEQAKLEKSFDEISDEIDDLKNKNINLKTKYETLKCAVKSLGSDVEKIDKNEKLHWVETTDSDGNTSGCITIDPSDNDIFVYQNSLEWLCGDC